MLNFSPIMSFKESACKLWFVLIGRYAFLHCFCVWWYLLTEVCVGCSFPEYHTWIVALVNCGDHQLRQIWYLFRRLKIWNSYYYLFLFPHHVDPIWLFAPLKKQYFIIIWLISIDWFPIQFFKLYNLKFSEAVRSSCHKLYTLTNAWSLF